MAVYFFGSSVYGRKSKRSDFDIGIIFNKPEKILNNPRQSLKIYEKLFDIFTPLVTNSNHLDLVFLQTAPLSLQKEILLKGKLVYCQDESKLLDYKEKVLLKYVNIKPLLDEFTKEIYQTRL